MYYFEIKRGDILMINFGNYKIGSVQQGTRMALCLSNNQGNKYSTILTVAPYTSQEKTSLPVHLTMEGYGLKLPSTLLLEQTTVISKMQVIKKVGHIDNEEIMNEINKKLKIQLAL